METEDQITPKKIIGKGEYKEEHDDLNQNQQEEVVDPNEINLFHDSELEDSDPEFKT